MIWHVSSDPRSHGAVPHRSLRLVCATPAPRTLPRLPGMVRVLEEWLRRTAPSRAAYRDPSTLRARLRGAARDIGATIRLARRRRMEAAEARPPSGGPRRPTEVGPTIHSLRRQALAHHHRQTIDSLRPQAALLQARAALTQTYEQWVEEKTQQGLWEQQPQQQHARQRRSATSAGDFHPGGVELLPPLAREATLAAVDPRVERADPGNGFEASPENVGSSHPALLLPLQQRQQARQRRSVISAGRFHLGGAELLPPLARAATLAAVDLRVEHTDPGNGFKPAPENEGPSHHTLPRATAQALQLRWDMSSQRSEMSSQNIRDFCRLCSLP